MMGVVSEIKKARSVELPLVQIVPEELEKVKDKNSNFYLNLIFMDGYQYPVDRVKNNS